MKKTLALLMTLILLLTACGKKEPEPSLSDRVEGSEVQMELPRPEPEPEEFEIVLLPEDADLTWAPDVIVEPEEPPYNLGGWRGGNTVSWYLDIPKSGTYDLALEYALPPNYAPASAALELQPEGCNTVGGWYDLDATSTEDNDWSEYATYWDWYVLPEGPVELILEPDEYVETEYLMNLRSITLTYDPEGPTWEEFQEEAWEDEDEDADRETGDLSLYEGWWQVPDDYEAEGISLFDRFYLDAQEGTCTPYSEFGDPMEPLDCWVQEQDGMEYLIVDLVLDSIYYYYEDECLLDAEDDSLDFVRVEEPGFDTSVNLDGIWVRRGEPVPEDWYELLDKDYVKLTGDPEDPDVLQEGKVEMSRTIRQISDYVVEDVLTLHTGDFMPDLIPSPDETILFEEDGFDYAIYVRYDYANPDMVPLYTTMEEIMNANLVAYEGDTMYRLWFHPHCFQVMAYTLEGDTYENQGTIYAGTWEILDDNYLGMYPDDEDDYWLSVPYDGEVYLEALDLTFTVEMD